MPYDYICIGTLHQVISKGDNRKSYSENPCMPYNFQYSFTPNIMSILIESCKHKMSKMNSLHLSCTELVNVFYVRGKSTYIRSLLEYLTMMLYSNFSQTERLPVTVQGSHKQY